MENDQKIHLGSLETEYNQERFDIFAETDSLSDFDWFVHYISIYFCYDNQVVLVRRGIIGVELEHLLKYLENLHSGIKCMPQESVGIDLGWLWNAHWQTIACAELTKKKLDSWDWPGSELLFLQCNSNGTLSNNTFLYQDESDRYVLQISSCYPYFFMHDPSSVEYDQWLPHYKILYRKEVSKPVIERWIVRLAEICISHRKYSHVDAEN